METEFSKWTTQLERLAQEGVKKEIALHKAQGNAIFYSRGGTLIMELADGRCFEYMRKNGKRKIIRSVPARD